MSRFGDIVSGVFAPVLAMTRAFVTVKEYSFLSGDKVNAKTTYSGFWRSGKMSTSRLKQASGICQPARETQFEPCGPGSVASRRRADYEVPKLAAEVAAKVPPTTATDSGIRVEAVASKGVCRELAARGLFCFRLFSAGALDSSIYAGCLSRA